MISAKLIRVAVLLSLLTVNTSLACPTCSQCDRSSIAPQTTVRYYQTCSNGYRLDVATADVKSADNSDLTVELIQASDASTYQRANVQCFRLEDVPSLSFINEVIVRCNNLLTSCDVYSRVQFRCTLISASVPLKLGLTVMLATLLSLLGVL